MAINMINNLFPPQVETFQPAFIYNTSPSISFSISSFNTAADIKYVHVSVVDQRNNENALLGVLPQANIGSIKNEYFITVGNAGYGLINGILIVEFPQKIDSIQEGELIQYDRKTDKYVLSIPTELLRQENTVLIDTPVYSATEVTEDGKPVVTSETSETKYFNVGQYYKVQIRFDSCTKEDLSILSNGLAQTASSIINAEKLAEQKQDFYERFINYLVRYRLYFSEWSEVTLIKPILHANFKFPQLEDSNLETGLKGLNQGIVPLSASVVMQDKLLYKEKLKSTPDLTKFTNVDGLIDETEHVERFKITVFPMDENGVVDYETTNYKGDWEYTTLREDTKTVEYGINTVIELESDDVGSYHALVIEYYTNNNYYGTDVRYFESNALEERLKPPRWNILEDSAHKNYKEYLVVNDEDGVAKIRFRWSVTEACANVDFTVSACILYIRRASSLDNFKTWTLMSVTYHDEQDITDSDNCIALDYDDYTLCSLVRYRYSAQIHVLKTSTHGDDKGKVIQATWTKPYKSMTIYPKFYDMLLQRQNRQIAIRYNGQVSSWKPVVNRQKVDTLGGRYPKFVENAQMNYKQFSISGLISAEGDFNRTFLSEFNGEFVKHTGSGTGDYILKNGKYVFASALDDDEDIDTYDWVYYYKDDIQIYDKNLDGTYLLRNDTIPDGEYGYNPDLQINEYSSGTVHGWSSEQTAWMLRDSGVAGDLKHGYDKSIFTDEIASNKYASYYQHDIYPTDNWFWERTFREELTKWLNDGEPKLYRSMPEGNIAVMLTDVSLTPNQQLGRRLYNFSATMYEIGDGNDLDVLDSLGIYNVPKLINSYGEVTTQADSDFLDDKDDEEDENSPFSSTIQAFGQLWLPRIYGYDLINGAALSSGTDKNPSYVWENMSIAERIASQYMGYYKDYSVKGAVKLKWARLQFISKPKYYTANYNSGTIPGADWKAVDMLPTSNTTLTKKYSLPSSTATNGTVDITMGQTVTNKNTLTHKNQRQWLNSSEDFIIKAIDMSNYNGRGVYKTWTIQFLDGNQYLSNEQQEILSISPAAAAPIDVEYDCLDITTHPTTDNASSDFIKRIVAGLPVDSSVSVTVKDYSDINETNQTAVTKWTHKQFHDKYGNLTRWTQQLENSNATNQYYYSIYDPDTYTLTFYSIVSLAKAPTFTKYEQDGDENYILYNWTKAPSAQVLSLSATATRATNGSTQSLKITWIPLSQTFMIENAGDNNYSQIAVHFEYKHNEVSVQNLEDANPLNLDSSTLSLGYNFWLNNSEIFVNERGFYQVPKKSNISHLILKGPEFKGDHEDLVIIDYKVAYKRLHNTDNIPVRTTRVEKIIGQWGHMFPYRTGVYDNIYRKYYYEKYVLPNSSGQYEWMVDFPPYYELSGEFFTRTDGSIAKVKKVGSYWKLADSNGVNFDFASGYNFESMNQAVMWLWMYDVGKIQQAKLPREYVQYLNTWQGISVDVTPYALLKVTYPDYALDTMLVVGRSGSLSFIEENPVDEIVFMGRRMVQAPRSRQPYLDEWEYVLDDILSAESGVYDAAERVNWIQWYNNQPEATQVEVAFYFGKTVEEMAQALTSVTDDMKRGLYPYWLRMYYNTTTEIQKPQYNTVYPIAVSGQTYYYIYYIDDQWYEVDPLVEYSPTGESTGKITIANMEKDGTIIAKVPIYGYVNYRGEILRSYL